MSAGKTHYFGPVADIDSHYESIGLPIPLHVNPAEYLLELVNVDFAPHRGTAQQNLEELSLSWSISPRAKAATDAIRGVEQSGAGSVLTVEQEKRPSSLSLTMTLLHRSFVKSYRDVVAYGIRIAMYTGLAILLGTVWVRLSTNQESIIPFTNAICKSTSHYLTP